MCDRVLSLWFQFDAFQIISPKFQLTILSDSCLDGSAVSHTAGGDACCTAS